MVQHLSLLCMCINNNCIVAIMQCNITCSAFKKLYRNFMYVDVFGLRTKMTHLLYVGLFCV